MNVITGDLLTLERGIIVHGCNCKGAMGSGIAGQIREKWPQVYEDYKFHEKLYGLNLGEVIYTRINDGLIIASALTQDDYGGPKSKDILFADYDAIEFAFRKIWKVAKRTGLEVHFPLIGCGLANGDWEVVDEILEAVIPDESKRALWIRPVDKNPYVKEVVNDSAE